MRPVGTVLTGRNLWYGLLSLESRGLTVGLVRLSPHGKTTLIKYEDTVQFTAGLTAHGVLAYGVASSRLHLTGWAASHAERVRLITRDLERCAELGLAGYIINICEMIETYGEVAEVLRETAHVGVPIIGRPSGAGIEAHAGIPGLLLYLDVAHEWMMMGDPRLAETGWQSWLDTLKGRVALLGPSNATLAPSFYRMPIVAGSIPLDFYRVILTEFETVPVVLEGTPFQVTVDLDVIRQLDARVVTPA